MSGSDPFLHTHKNTYRKYSVKMSGSDPFLQIHSLSKNILGKNEWIRPISTYT